MGRLPEHNATKEDKDGFLSVGEKEMLAALESTFDAVKDGSITTDDYSFRFTTAKVNKQAGYFKTTYRRRQSCAAKLSFEVKISGISGSGAAVPRMFIAVKTAFQAVENGSLKEGGYYFELTTPHFHFKSGHYPPKGKRERTCTEPGKEPVPCSPGGYFPKVNVSWKHPLLNELPALIKELLEEIGMHNPSQQKHTSFFGNLLYLVQLAFVLEFALMVIPLVHVRASPVAKEEQPLTLTAGTNGIVPFECNNEHQSASKYYTVQFEGKDRPFFHDGMLDPEGLMSPNQAGRFTVEYHENGNAMSIKISITSISIEDQGTYIVMVIVQGGAPEHHLMKRVVIIFIPPGPAECFLMRSESYQNYYQIHCHSNPGNGNSTLTCFQNSEKMRYLQNTVNTNQVVHSRIFWLMDLDIPFSCCAHDVKEIHSITQDSCNQYRYPRIEPVTKPLPPGNKAPTEIARTTKPLPIMPIEEENEKFPAEATSYAGYTPSFAWPTLLLPAMTVMTYTCISNP